MVRAAGRPGGLLPHEHPPDVCAEAATANEAARVTARIRRIFLLLYDFLEHCDGFDFDEQFRAAKLRLDSGGCRQRVKSLLFEKRSTLFVELCVIAIDIAQVASCADDVLPGR